MIYKLKTFHQPNSREDEQYLRFLDREPTEDSKMLVTAKNGTTVREVLKTCVLELDRLNKQLPTVENVLAINDINFAIEQLNNREKDRKARGVEGYHIP